VTIKRAIVGLVTGLSLWLLAPSDASAAACVNAVNVSGTGEATQTNTCSTDADVTTPDTDLPDSPA